MTKDEMKAEFMALVRGIDVRAIRALVQSHTSGIRWNGSSKGDMARWYSGDCCYATTCDATRNSFRQGVTVLRRRIDAQAVLQGVVTEMQIARAAVERTLSDLDATILHGRLLSDEDKAAKLDEAVLAFEQAAGKVRLTQTTLRRQE